MIGEQPAIDVEDLADKPADLAGGERESQRRGPGLCGGEMLDESFCRPSDRLEFPVPGEEQFVDADVPLHRTSRPGCDPTRPVSVLTGAGEVLGDVVGPFREQLTDGVGNPDDAPVPQMPGRAGIGFDVEAQLDRPRRRVKPTDHRGRFDRVTQ